MAGRSLNSVEFNEDAENHPVQSISYPYLDEFISAINVNGNDVVVDVGCGWGRLLGYLAEKTGAQRYVGIELNPVAASNASKSLSSFANIEIIEGDAIKLLPYDSSLIILFNPFGASTLASFLDEIEKKCERGTRLYYLYPQHRAVLESAERNRWQIASERELKPKHLGPIQLIEYVLS